jgi:hypothetical protein
MDKTYEVVPSSAALAKRESDIPDKLPQLPMRMCIYGSSNSGKGVLIASLLSKAFPYKKIFKKNIWIFSPTISLGDPSFSDVDLPEDRFVADYDEGMINRIWREADKIIKAHGKSVAPHLLFIMDDVVTALTNSKTSLLRKLYFSGRHSLISTISCSQMYSALPRAVRMNASDAIFFEAGRKARMLIGEEQSIDPDQFEAIMEQATSDAPYSFLYVRYKRPIPERYMLRFTGRCFEIPR